MQAYAYLSKLSDLVSREGQARFNRVWASIDPGPEASVAQMNAARDALLVQYPQLVETYGYDMGAGLAADWYEDTRAASLGAPGQARLASMDPAQVEGDVRYAVKHFYEELGPVDPLQTRDTLALRLEKHIRNAIGATIVASAGADARPVRWARITSGADTCSFCLMLASRGFMYASAKSTGFEHPFHHGCRCQIVPDFALDASEHEAYEADVEDLYRRYQESVAAP